MKLDRLLARQSAAGRSRAHRWLAARKVRIDGEIVTDSHHEVDRFSCVAVEDKIVQEPERALYLMLHKPVGVLSATVDEQHPTVLDLIDHPDKHTLHIAGRLDRNASGLVILTNHGHWSKQLMAPEKKVSKVYRVETRDLISPEDVAAFAKGFYFHTEDLTTRPAHLELLGDREARLTLHEGRYHQIKRMFHRVNNLVLRLHRESIGHILLPSDLAPGQWRPLTEVERASVPLRH